MLRSVSFFVESQLLTRFDSARIIGTARDKLGSGREIIEV